MAIAFDATSNSGYQTTTPYSWSHTCTGSSRVLIVGVSMLSVAGSSVTGITYNGVALTKIRSDISAVGAVRTELWRLVNPASGSNTVEVTLSATLDSIAAAVSLTGVNQTNPTGSHNGASATNVGAADATVSVSTTADGSWLIDAVATTDTAITVGAGQTQRSNVSGTLGSGGTSTEGPKTPTGSVTMSWTDVGAAATWTVSAVEIAEEQKAAVIYFP